MACAMKRTILSLVDDPTASARALLVSWACTYGYDLAPLAAKCHEEAASIAELPRRLHATRADLEGLRIAFAAVRGEYGPVPSVPRLNLYE